MLQIIKVGTKVRHGATRYIMHLLIPENPCIMYWPEYVVITAQLCPEANSAKPYTTALDLHKTFLNSTDADFKVRLLHVLLSSERSSTHIVAESDTMATFTISARNKANAFSSKKNTDASLTASHDDGMFLDITKEECRKRLCGTTRALISATASETA